MPRALLFFHSEVLARELDDKKMIVLPHFADCTDIFEQCLEILKGQETEINTENFKNFLKFAIIYQIKALHSSLLLWIKAEVTKSRVSFMFLHDCAGIENSHDKKREDLLRMCWKFLDNSELFKIVEHELYSLPADSVSDSFLSLLVDPSYICYTIPVLNRLVDSQSRAEFILPLISKKRVLEVACTSKFFTETFFSKLECLLENSSKSQEFQEFVLTSQLYWI